MIDAIGKLVSENFVWIGICGMIIGTLIFGFTERNFREKNRSIRMSEEVDRYDPEEPAGM